MEELEQHLTNKYDIWASCMINPTHVNTTKIEFDKARATMTILGWTFNPKIVWSGARSSSYPNFILALTGLIQTEDEGKQITIAKDGECQIGGEKRRFAYFNEEYKVVPLHGRIQKVTVPPDSPFSLYNSTVIVKGEAQNERLINPLGPHVISGHIGMEGALNTGYVFENPRIPKLDLMHLLTVRMPMDAQA